MVKKPIKERPPLEEAIATLDSAVKKLDEMIKIMQDSQATLRNWLDKGEEIGWIDDARK